MLRRSPLHPRRAVLAAVLLGVMVGVLFILWNSPVSPVTEMPTLAVNTPGDVTVHQPTATPTQAALMVKDQAAIFIPRLSLYANIVELYLQGDGWNVVGLGGNIGHLQGTAWLDNPGNIVLAGHVELRDGSLGVFADLHTLAAGDTVILRHDESERRYAVTTVQNVPADDLMVLYPTRTERLTLITCDDYDFLSGTYLTRTVVVAERTA